MHVELLDEAGNSARYVYNDGAGNEIASFGPYPPIVGDVRPLFEAWRASGGSPVAYSPTVTGADVDAERDRRLPLGVSFQGHLFQTRPFDIDNMTGAATAALAAIVQGAQPGNLRWADPNADFGWIDADNATVPMDAQTMLGLAQTAMARRAALIFAGRAIKDRLAAGQISAASEIAAAFDAALG